MFSDSFQAETSFLTVVHADGMLRNERTGTGEHLCNEQPIFAGAKTKMFNQKTKAHGIDYVLREIQYMGPDMATSTLKKRFDEFDEIYKKLVQEHLKRDMDVEKDLDGLIAATLSLVGSYGDTQEPDNIVWKRDMEYLVPQLLAHIFALWTLNNAQNYFDALGSGADKDDFLLMPRAAQIVSIFSILGIGRDHARFALHNNLVEIGTGEGKSLTLAATSIVLALFGFDVSCACYSEYLSRRDFKMFAYLFEALGVKKYIHYGTFDELCERFFVRNSHVKFYFSFTCEFRVINKDGM